MQDFEMKDLGLTHYFLGLEVFQDDSQFFVSQIKYANDLLHKFGLENCTTVATPIAHGESLSKEDGVARVDVHTYRSMVGSLIFLTNSRPDICHIISLVPRYISLPSKIHLKAAKRILRYAKGTLNFGIHYLKNKDVKLVGYSDSDWWNNIDDRKSTLGHCFSLGSSLVTWSLRKQTTIAPSSIEAKYIAITSASA